MSTLLSHNVLLFSAALNMFAPQTTLSPLSLSLSLFYLTDLDSRLSVATHCDPNKP